MKNTMLLLILCFILSHLDAQNFKHHDFLGAGHDNGITVTTSSSTTTAKGTKTVDGFPIDNDEQLKDASRFLAQSTFGADMPTIQMTAAMGYEAWLDEQFSLPQTKIFPKMYQQSALYATPEELGEEAGLYKPWYESAWMHNNLTAADLLRQRMTFILSQIMVINNNSDLFEDNSQMGGNYYDLLGNNAFENYRSLINDVTLSPAMGLFLSHYNNPKADPSKNIHPDENYAREIMQLFSIGLWELDEYGRRKYDADNQFIPTYTNADIKEFAQVFTGLGDGSPGGVFGDMDEEGDGEGDFFKSIITPMKMYDAFHDTSEKNLLNDVTLPAGQSGMEDIAQTLDHLSSHANTAPFLTKSLIKFLTTSNPSDAYVKRVVDVFNPFEENNFQKVIKAILLDPEARNCQRSDTYTFGKLREPLMRYLNYLRAFPLSSSTGEFLYEFGDVLANTGQAPLRAPSVFNFFLPDYSPQGPINQQYRVAPEFQILNSTNSIGLVNLINGLSIERNYLASDVIDGDELSGAVPSYQVDFSEVEAMASNSSALINYLDILLANGLLTTETKGIIKQAVEHLSNPADRVKMASYLIMISPDCAILK
ncbi:MAG: DUF1800 family protein [Bacteroidota bacterium]